MADIIHQLVIRTFSDKVFRAITEQEGLSGWWTDNVVVKSVEGGFAEFNFGDTYYIKMKVLKLENNRSVIWECVEGDDEWLGTQIRFILEEQ